MPDEPTIICSLYDAATHLLRQPAPTQEQFNAALTLLVEAKNVRTSRDALSKVISAREDSAAVERECVICNDLIGVNPQMHARLYGHDPQFRAEGVQWQWSRTDQAYFAVAYQVEATRAHMAAWANGTETHRGESDFDPLPEDLPAPQMYPADIVPLAPGITCSPTHCNSPTGCLAPNCYGHLASLADVSRETTASGRPLAACGATAGHVPHEATTREGVIWSCTGAPASEVIGWPDADDIVAKS